MYIPWEWIEKNLNLPKWCSPSPFVKKLNYYGLECEQDGDSPFINFIPAHNRKDLRSWWGLAREIAILLDLQKPIFFSHVQSEKKDKDIIHNEKSNVISIKSEKVLSYHASVIGNLYNHKVPFWIESCLLKNGIRLINPIVDIANLVSIETGQPFHVFDWSKLSKNSSPEVLTVREANNNEMLVDLTGRQVVLKEGIVIATNDEQIVQISGIIGSKSTSVQQSTTSVLVESASFLSSSISKSSDLLEIQTKASKVFADQLNRESTWDALERVTKLIKKYCQQKPSSIDDFSFYENHNYAEKEVVITLSFLTKKLGVVIQSFQLETILKRLSFSFSSTDETYTVKIPTFRSDILIEEDLLEEIGKILDYNKLSSRLPSYLNQFTDSKFNKLRGLKQKIVYFLVSSGYQQVISYSLVEKLNIDKISDEFAIISPKNKTRAIYRKSLVESHLEIINNNHRQGEKDIRIFEIANVYKRIGETTSSEEVLSIAAAGRLLSSHVHKLEFPIDLYWIKGLLENILMILSINDEPLFTKEKDEKQNRIFWKISVANEQIGSLSENTEKVSQFGQQSSFVMELLLSQLLIIANSNSEKQFLELSHLPLITKNISFVVQKKTSIYQIKEAISNKAGAFLKEVSLVDIYEKEKNSTVHSLNFQLLFQGKDENLLNSEIEKDIEKVWRFLIEEFTVVRR